MSVRDPGLQPERTSLAWGRTALGLALNAVLFLRTALQENHSGLLAAGLALCGGAAVIVHAAAHRRAELRDGWRPSTPWLVPGVVVLAAGASVVAAVGFGFPAR